MDEAARALGIDPLALRLQNLAHPGEAFIPGDTPADGDWARTARGGGRRGGGGRGAGAGRGPGGGGGGGGGWLRVVRGSRALVPYARQASASRSSVFMGNSILLACRDIQAKIRAMAARLEPVDEAAVVVERGEVRIGGRVTPIRDVLVRGLGRLGGELIGIGEMRKEAEPEHPLGGTAAFFEFNCTAVEVEVDRETGDVVVARHVTVSDVGKAMNPIQVRGQDEGAAIMGLGHTLMEHIIHDEAGRIRNLGAIDYRIPTSLDLPLRMESDFVENADGPGPYGAKGMSEGALLCVAPAVAASVHDATGVRIRDLPLSPERVWRALHDAAESPDAGAPEAIDAR